MSSIKSLQRVIDELRTGNLPDSDCVDLLRHPSPVVRANAIDAVAKRSAGKGNLLDELFDPANDSANETRLMGTTKVSDVAVCALLRTGHNRAIEFARKYIASLSDTSRADLVAYLISEGINMPDWNSS